ncbi:MAG: rhomboid family intramembrane serine protease [Bacteroidetes bacterium]|nr:MAG: rhomboid family intramembrane serine protease [Bacteroidota bacterium]
MYITFIVIFITVVTSYLAFNNRETFYNLKFNAYLIHHNRQYYRFFSYGLIHVDWMHLLINMFVLFSFGTAVESSFSMHFGAKANLFYVLLYIGGVGFSTLAAYLKHKDHDYYNAVGASGAVSAILFSAIIMRPDMSVMFIFLPIPIPSYIFGVLYLVYSAYMAKKANDNIGHDAHFWGAIFGLVFTILLNPLFVTQFFEYIF